MTENSTENKLVYAGFWIRIFAGILDVLFLLPIFFLLVYILGPNDYQMIKIGDDLGQYSQIGVQTKTSLADYINYALSIAYITYFLSKKGQATLGKKFLKIYVGNPDGSRLSAGRSLARAVGSIVTSMTLGLGFLPVVFTKEKVSLHDFICKTRVFHGKKD